VQVSSSTVSLTVDDVEQSRVFFVDHLGYKEKMSADGFVSLGREDAAVNLVFLRRGLEVLPEGFRDVHAAGVIVALVVTDLDAELARLTGEGVAITLPLREELWGERLFQVTDPNGVVVEFVQWA
jgi:catechol 2,3-dioxygenase-like lactoylglutathione lyase family enzyme